MPQLRLLDPEELGRRGRRRVSERQRIAAEYDHMLASLAPGQYAEVELEEGEKRLTVRNRLLRAADRRGLKIRFQRTRGPRLVFLVAELLPESDDDLSYAVGSAPRPDGAGRPERGEAGTGPRPESGAPNPLRRRGRPRRNG